MDATTTYQKFVQYYDAYVSKFDDDLAFYKSFCYPDENILEVGCGTGRVLKSFLEAGFHIVGVDISPEMLDVAHMKLATFCDQGKLRLKRHNFLDKPLYGRFDKILVTFYTFNYIVEEPELFLSNLFRSMGEDGTLIMDLFYPKTLVHPELEDAWSGREIMCQSRVVHMKDKRTFSKELETRIQIYQADGEETRIETVRKYYSPEAIKSLLETVGFQDIVFTTGYDAGNFQPTLNLDLTSNYVVKAVKKTASSQ